MATTEEMLTVCSNGSIQPIVSGNRNSTASAAAFRHKITISARIEWAMIVNPIGRGVLPIGESRHLGLPNNDCTLVDQVLDSWGRLVRHILKREKGFVRCSPVYAFYVEIVLDGDTKPSQWLGIVCVKVES